MKPLSTLLGKNGVLILMFTGDSIHVVEPEINVEMVKILKLLIYFGLKIYNNVILYIFIFYIIDKYCVCNQSSFRNNFCRFSLLTPPRGR